MLRLDSLRADWAVLRQMLRGAPAAASHAQRLQAFYAPQARDYDRFRERLLHGRQELIERLPLPRGARVVELGGGTGRNVDFFGTRIADVASLEIVDLCPALLERARIRAAADPRIRVVEADATGYRPPQPVDCVYLSYAVTMIPDWRAALANAVAMLKPGGVLGVVDFYHSAPHPPAGLVRHGALTRAFWRSWFAHDGVRLHPDHLAWLRARLPDHELRERRAALPYMPFVRAPYYVFVGRKERV